MKKVLLNSIKYVSCKYLWVLIISQIFNFIPNPFIRYFIKKTAVVLVFPSPKIWICHNRETNTAPFHVQVPPRLSNYHLIFYYTIPI